VNSAAHCGVRQREAVRTPLVGVRVGAHAGLRRGRGRLAAGHIGVVWRSAVLGVAALEVRREIGEGNIGEATQE